MQLKDLLSDELKDKLISDYSDEEKLDFARKGEDIDKALETFLELGEIDEEQAKILKEMYSKNNKVIEHIDFKLLDSKYIDTLGIDKVNQISCYPEVQQEILSLDEKRYQLFQKCLNNYLNRSKKSAQWTLMARMLLDNIESDGYADLIDDIKDVDELDDEFIEKLSKIMQKKNFFKIKKEKHVRYFEKGKRNLCDKIIESNEDIKVKRECLLIKVFGQSTGYTFRILQKFGKDIDNIENEELKDYVNALKYIMEIDDPDIIKEIYDNTEEIELIDQNLMERDLKTEYAKLYNKTLWTYEGKEQMTKEELDNLQEGLGDKLEGMKVYDMGTDFRGIVHSISPYTENDDLKIAGVGDEKNNFKKNWNRADIYSQFRCMSYIGNDMQGTADIPLAVYGFTNMDEGSLLFSGPIDIYSHPDFVPFIDCDEDEIYYKPDNQIKETDQYSEMDYSIYQNGEIKQPDYIILMKGYEEPGKFHNIDTVLKAYNDWEGKVPIAIWDIDKCQEVQRKQVEDMLEEYHKTKDLVLGNEIMQKVKSNRQIFRIKEEDDFCFDLQAEFDSIKKEIQDQEDATIDDNVIIGNKKDEKVNEKALEEIYEKVENDLIEVEKQGKFRELLNAIKGLFNKKGGRE